MMESIENGIQLITTGICAFAAAGLAVRSRSRTWALLGLFSGVFFLGDLYWFLFLVFYGETPGFSLIPDMSWYAGLLFLYLLLVHVGDETESVKIIWPVPAFTAGMCIFYMQWGQYASNLIYAVLYTLILMRTVGALRKFRGGGETEKKRHRSLYRLVILFSALEYGMWTASCFFSYESPANPYYWFDILLSVSFLLFIPAVRKAVDR